MGKGETRVPSDDILGKLTGLYKHTLLHMYVSKFSSTIYPTPLKQFTCFYKQNHSLKVLLLKGNRTLFTIHNAMHKSNN